jgi:uncharacterized protein (TIGR02271 family)
MSTNSETDPLRDQEGFTASGATDGGLIDRLPAADGDSGEIETLPDGSISIPILEEELVVTKRIVVRERIVVHKEVVTETEHVEAELRRERVEIDEGDETPAA